VPWSLVARAFLWAWGLPMSTSQFNVGDRVQTRAAGVVVVGTQGTIHQVAHAMPDAYVVLFDGWADPFLMPAGDLELIDASERARGANHQNNAPQEGPRARRRVV
jgi:hypothetical protein